MEEILIAWAVSAAVMVTLAIVLGYTVVTVGKGPFGILVDSRGRMSLNHLQLTLWTLVIISLISGIFFGRWIGSADPLNFEIPGNVLGLLGISAGSAVTTGAVKAAKQVTAKKRLATKANTGNPPELGQVFLLEEGEYADQVVDVTKFQNFLFTVVLVTAYVGLAIHAIVNAKVAGKVEALPDLKGTFLILLGISHAGYVAGKLPSQAGDAPVREVDHAA